ncbi:techylectin-5A [Nephila pilipes]|uniref:Techylectin-5A n=1 Tax=Nephila pilipes TaxID=299642 RepID=A0A8X6NYU9_NEPPI|nr:techylectin-5A [Nephila pilipes]
MKIRKGAGDALSTHDDWVFYTGARPNRRGEQDEFIHTGAMVKMLFHFAAVLVLISSDFSSTAGAKLDITREVINNRNLAQFTRYEGSIVEQVTCKNHTKPMDCGEVLENGNTESGVYTIWPRSRVSDCESFEVYCDMDTAGGGWTVIQRRGDFGNAQNYFDKEWKDYKKGFGNLKREFWIGNDNIHVISNQGKYSVRFDMKNKEGKSVFAVYDTFYIDDESTKYKFHLAQYSGNAGDALSTHNNRLFYTKDQHNIPPDRKKGTNMHTGGWWFNVFPSTCLNALNNNGGKHKIVEQGIAWSTFGGYKSTISSTEIKLRLKNQ